MSTFSTRLSMSVTADDPKEAVQLWMNRAIKLGLQNFYFRVENDDTGEVWMVSVSPTHPVMVSWEDFVEMYRYDLEQAPAEEPSLEYLLYGEAGMPDAAPVAPPEDSDAAQAEAAVAKQMAARKAQRNGRAR